MNIHHILIFLNLCYFSFWSYYIAIRIFYNIFFHYFSFPVFLNYIFFMFYYRPIFCLINLNSIFLLSNSHSIWIHYNIGLNHHHSTLGFYDFWFMFMHVALIVPLNLYNISLDSDHFAARILHCISVYKCSFALFLNQLLFTSMSISEFVYCDLCSCIYEWLFLILNLDSFWLSM